MRLAENGYFSVDKNVEYGRTLTWSFRFDLELMRKRPEYLVWSIPMGGPADRVCHIGARLPSEQAKSRKYVNICDSLRTNIACSAAQLRADKTTPAEILLSGEPASKAQALNPLCRVSAVSAIANCEAERASTQGGAILQQSATPAFIAGWPAWSGQSPRPRVESFA